MDCSRCSATAEVATGRVATAQDTAADIATVRGGVAAREFADAASRDSDDVAARVGSGLFVVPEFAAIAVCGSHRCGSNRDCDSNRGFDLTADDSRSVVVAGVAIRIRDLTVAGAILPVAVAPRCAAAGAVAPNAADAPASFGSDPDAVVPNVFAAPASRGSVPVAAGLNAVAVPGSGVHGVAPDAVAPSAAVVPESYGSDSGAVAPSAADAPASCGSVPVVVVPSAVVVPESHFVVAAVAALHAVAVEPVVVFVPPAVECDAVRVVLVVPADVVRAEPDSRRCAPVRDRAGLVHRRR